MRKYHQRPLLDNYLYLILDGLTLKVKQALGIKKRVVLCAYGITKEGRKEMISFRQASKESEREWLTFLNDLYKRGLKGKDLKLITSDGSPGLKLALQTVYPYTPYQRCWVHKLRNVANRLPKVKQKECLFRSQTNLPCPSSERSHQSLLEMG